MNTYSWATRYRRLGTGLRPTRNADHSAVLAARLRAEQDGLLAEWATGLDGKYRRWLHSTRR